MNRNESIHIILITLAILSVLLFIVGVAVYVVDENKKLRGDLDQLEGQQGIIIGELETVTIYLNEKVMILVRGERNFTIYADEAKRLKKELIKHFD